MPITLAYILADTARLTHLIERFHLGDTLRANSLFTWIALLVCIFIGLTAGKTAQTVLRGLARALIKRGWNLRGTIFNNASGPASLALITAGLSVGLTQLTLSADLQSLRHKTIVVLFTTCIAWFAYNLVDLIDVTLRHLTSKTESKLDDQMVPLLRKALRLFLVVVFGLFTAENVFGADITAWVTGLGIAGLAVSLAAQESIKNLFGSITIFMDRPFAIGDAVAFCGYEGSVEEIGFRSTKLRTALGHVVTVPNSKIVDSTVENIARRPSIRRQFDIALAPTNSAESVEHAVRLIRETFADPEIAGAFDLESAPPRAFFSDLGAASFNIRILYWFRPSEYWAFIEHAEKFNFKLLRAFDDAGIAFASPPQPAAIPQADRPPIRAVA